MALLAIVVLPLPHHSTAVLIRHAIGPKKIVPSFNRDRMICSVQRTCGKLSHSASSLQFIGRTGM
jgi:hypothetical protein